MSREVCHVKRPVQTGDLILSLRGDGTGKRERAALEDLKTRMLQEFSDNSTSLFYWDEACMLSLVASEAEYERLVYAFSIAITEGVADNRPVNLDLLGCFARCLRQSKHEIPCERARYGSVLGALNTHLTNDIRSNNPHAIYHLLLAVSTVLDAMVDIKFSEIDRKSLHSPLKKTLDSLTVSPEPRISQAAKYASQALARVPDNEGPWEEFFRVSGDSIQAIAEISGGIAKFDPSRILDTGPRLVKLLSFFADAVKAGKEIWDTREDLKQVAKAIQDVSERKGWYDALRHTEALILSGALSGLRKILPTLSPRCLSKGSFWCGMFSQLERQWISQTEQRENIEELIEWTLNEKSLRDYWEKSHSFQYWITLVGDSLHHPEWKDIARKRKHRFSSILREKTVDPKLRSVSLQGQLEAGLADSRLLRKAMESSECARLFYADAVLARYYTAGSPSLLHIKRLSGDDIPIETCYVNLSLVEQNSERSKDGEVASSLQARLKAEAPNAAKEISLRGLFKSRELRNKQFRKPTRILIRGRAGVGKTTLCKKIVHDFLHSQLWESDYDRIVWLPLRKLRECGTLEHFLDTAIFTKVPDGRGLFNTLKDTLNSTPSTRTLFLLDGLDEIVGDQRPGGSLIESISDLLNRKHVIITSRPHAGFPPGLDLYDLEIETVGFHDQEIKSYVENAVPDLSQQQQIMDFINGHWAVKGLMRIPIQIDALCFTWSRDRFDERQPTTMTSLYSNIETKLWGKDMVRMGVKQKDGQTMSEYTAAEYRTQRQIYDLMEKPVQLVRQMAFFGMYHGVTEFTSTMRAHIHDAVTGTTDRDLANISFLRSSDSSLRYREQDYYFLHLTFQEYFAAQHFAEHWKSGGRIPVLNLKSSKSLYISAADFLAQEKYNGRYNIMWRFVTGILDAEDLDEGNSLVSFFNQMTASSVDLFGPPHFRILAHCFSEIRDIKSKSGLTFVWDSTQSQLLQIFFYGRVLNSPRDLDSAFEFAFDLEFPEAIFLSILEKGSGDDKNLAVEAISRRDLLTTDLLDLILHFFRSEKDEGLRRRFGQTIIARHNSSPASIVELLCSPVPDGLGSGEYFLKGAPIYFDYWNCLPTQTLELMFSDSSSWSAMGAYVLRRQAKLPSSILQELESRLDNESAEIRTSAIDLLPGWLLSKKSIWSHVITGIGDSNTNVRLASLQALCRKPELSLDVKILRMIAKRLRSMSSDEMRSALMIFKLETQKPLPVDIVERLWIVLGSDPLVAYGTYRRAFEILLSHDAFSEDEFLMNFNKCDSKDIFSVAVTACCFELDIPLPEFICDHCIQLIENFDPDTGSKIQHRAKGVFSRFSLPAKIQMKLWKIYDTCSPKGKVSIAENIIGLQENIPESIVADLLSRFHVADEKDREICLRAVRKFRPLPVEIFDYATQVALNHVGKIPNACLELILGYKNLPIEILESVIVDLLTNITSRRFRSPISDIITLMKHNAGFESVLSRFTPDQWVAFLMFLLRLSLSSFMGGAICFVRDGLLHISIEGHRYQVSLEASETLQNLKTALDTVQQKIYAKCGQTYAELGFPVNENDLWSARI